MFHPHSVDVIESDEIPTSTLELATQKRTELIEQLAEVDDEIAELFLNDAQPSNTQIAAAIRRATVSLKFSPVFLGSAVKNTVVQPLLDGVCAYLASPAEREVFAHDTTQPTSTPQVELVPAAAAPLVALFTIRLLQLNLNIWQYRHVVLHSTSVHRFYGNRDV